MSIRWLTALVLVPCFFCGCDGTAKAKGLANKCDFAGALQVLETVKTTEPDIQLLRARILIQLHRDVEAAAILRALATDTQNKAIKKDIQLALGEALAHDPLNRSEAERTLADAEQLGADKDFVDEERAIILARSGMPDRAESLLVEVLRRDPSNAVVLYNIACAKALEGKANESAVLIRRAWKAGVKDPQELRTDPDLESVRATGQIDDLLKSNDTSCEFY